MINKIIDLRKEFMDSISDKAETMTPAETYFTSNAIACLSMCIDYLMGYEKAKSAETTANNTKES